MTEAELVAAAWRIVHEHGPAWRNDYFRKYPNSKASEATKADEMAHYCVVAALRNVLNKAAEIAA